MGLLAGERGDPHHVHAISDRNTPEIFEKRKRFIAQTVQRYEAYGDAYPISSILLLGTGWDNWTCTEDYSAFIRKFNAQADGGVRLVDARYEDFFMAAQGELREKNLPLPTLTGSFGTTWEERAAHLAGPTKDFREADRLLRLAEARQALDFAVGRADKAAAEGLKEGWRALLDFSEHDFGGTNAVTAALSAGVRADAAMRALTLARTFAPVTPAIQARDAGGKPHPSGATFSWRGGRVAFDPERCAIASLIDARGREWVPPQPGPALGEFIHLRYQDPNHYVDVLPRARVAATPEARTDHVVCSRDGEGLRIETAGRRWGFGFRTRWLFHERHPLIDVTYELEEGWTSAPQSVHFCFPVNLKKAVYHYDAPGVVLKAGPVASGGDDLPGANPELWAAQTFAAVSGSEGGLIVLTPDAPLVQFGAQWLQPSGTDPAILPAQISSLAMMNLTRNINQPSQGGQRRWEFRYRLVLSENPEYDPLAPFNEVQEFGTPPFLQTPGGELALPGLRALGIAFEGGPVTAFKVAEDGERLIVRLWNVQDRPVTGSLKLPAGWTGAENCDALERPLAPLRSEDGKVEFTAPARELCTIAFKKGA